MITKETDVIVHIDMPMKIHLGSRLPTRSGFYGLFLRGLAHPGELTFHQTNFSARHGQWFNADGNRKSASGLSERLDIMAWAECPNIVPMVGDFAIEKLKTIISNKE